MIPVIQRQCLGERGLAIDVLRKALDDLIKPKKKCFRCQLSWFDTDDCAF